MSTESLIIELDAKTSKLDAKLRKTERRLDELDDSVEKTDTGLKKLGGAVTVVGGALKDLAITAFAAGAAISAMAIGSAKGRKELELLSKQSKISIEDFQALTFATKQFGISAEQFADISKDISDKVGEYATAGTGAFQDYADVLGLTKKQAKETAIEFQNLTSEQVISRITKDLENAGATGAQTTFVLESLGNDLSRLAPLFANNSKELDKLTGAYTKINKELQITDAQSDQLSQLSTDFDLLTGSIGNATTKISASLAPALSELFNSVIAVTPQATQSVINFINTFREAESIKSISDVTEQLKIQKETLESLTREVEENKRGTAGGRTASENAVNVVAKLNERIAEEEERYLALNAQLFKLNQEKEKGILLDAKAEQGGVISTGGITGSEGGTTGATGGSSEAQLDAIRDRFKSEVELLVEKAREERGILDAQLEDEVERNELKVAIANELADKLIAIKARQSEEEKRENAELLKNRELTAKTEQKIESLKMQFADRTAKTLLSGALSNQDKLFTVVKDFGAGQIEAYGLVAGAKALAELGPIAGPPVAASYIGWSQVAAGIVRALPVGGGGGGTGPNDSSTAQPEAQQQQPDYQPETDTLEFTDSTPGGSTTQLVTFAADTGDALVDAIAEALNKRGSLS